MDGTKVLPSAVSSSYPLTISVPGWSRRASRARRFAQSLHRVCFLVPKMMSADWTIFMSIASLSSPHVQHLTFSSSSGACAYKQSFKKQMSSQFPQIPGPPKKPSRPTRGARLAQARPMARARFLGAWKSGSLESQKLQKVKNFKIQIRSAQNVGKVSVSKCTPFEL